MGGRGGRSGRRCGGGWWTWWVGGVVGNCRDLVESELVVLRVVVVNWVWSNGSEVSWK